MGSSSTTCNDIERDVAPKSTGMELTGENYCLITLDSCRFDTASRAQCKVLSEYGPPCQVWAHGTYTWPSHLSMMVGLMPNGPVEREDKYTNRLFHQLFRLSHNPTRGRSADLEVDGLTIPGGLRALGYTTLGYGAVSWFGGGHEQIWKSMFGGKFWYTGPNLRQQVENSLGLLEHAQPYFLFINVGETHLPYHFGEVKYSLLWEEFHGFEPLWKGAPRYSGSFRAVTAPTWEILRNRQVIALEWIDRQLERLLANLPQPVTVIVVGDHGDCLGEEGLLGHGFYHPKVLEVPMWVFRLPP
jgi:hypothetical protein